MDAQKTATQCRHYAMCKIDFLDTGICPAGKAHGYTGFYPQGRMDIYAALCQKKIPVTRALVEIADSCTLCDICDRQCYFVAGLRPRQVAAALKKKVKESLLHSSPQDPIPDPFLEKLQKIVGNRWATNDPAHRICYAHDPCPVSPETLPDYVALPADTRQVQRIVRLCNRHRVPFAVRGNGSSVMGFVLTPGLVIDTVRMRELHFDPKNWVVRIGAGISAFELQKEAQKRGFRVNAAEPSASCIGNIMCSGIFSLFSASYGTGADNFVDLEMVDRQGRILRLSDPGAPNLLAFQKTDAPLPGICTRAAIRLHPVFADETAAAVPFQNRSAAVKFARELAARRLGTGLGVLGTEYISTFLSPSPDLARQARSLFAEDLGIGALVLVLGDRHTLQAIQAMEVPVMSPGLIRTLILSLPNLCRQDWKSDLTGMGGDRPPYELFCRPEFEGILETLLEPSPQTLASGVDPDLRDFFTTLYARPEMTDILWLNTFRIISSRMGREGHVVAFILYIPLEDPRLVEKLDASFREITRSHRVRGDFGFLTPLDGGRMAVLEWDLYLDHTDPGEIKRMQGAMAAAGEMIEGYFERDPRVLWIRYLLYQGLARKESFLYHSAALK